MNHVDTVQVPEHGALAAWLADGDFRDAYRVRLTRPALSPIEIFLSSVRATPAWVATLMSIRNRVIRPFGLKDVGALDAGADRGAAGRRVGERLGIFSILACDDDELLLGIDDTHLDVRVSVQKSGAGAQAQCVVSTGVKVHNRLGRLYMLPVGRIHPQVVRALMRRAAV